jgi:hypothetical protein
MISGILCQSGGRDRSWEKIFASLICFAEPEA